MKLLSARSWPCAGLLLVYAALVAGGTPRAKAQAASTAVAIQSTGAPLRPDRPQQARVGALTYAGGLVLTAPKLAEFGGLSGIDVQPDGRFVSQTDFGDLLSGRIVLDARGRLAGLADTAWSRLTDEEGEPYRGAKSQADAEDITFLPGGGFAVSFEQTHRVEAYAAQGGPARRLSIPPEAAALPRNGGLEALTAWTDGQGRERLVEGAEDGRAWSCDPEGRDCAQILDPARDGPGEPFKLTGLDALPDGRGMVAVYRAFDILRGMRAVVAWVRPDEPQKITVLARIVPPYTVDNMEGIAAVKNPDGSIRLYLISDDNQNPLQRTILLAFDWREPASPKPARKRKTPAGRPAGV